MRIQIVCDANVPDVICSAMKYASKRWERTFTGDFATQITLPVTACGIPAGTVIDDLMMNVKCKHVSRALFIPCALTNTILHQGNILMETQV